ncbi:GerMN domain-containing protein [Cytobacillus dafuensis]|uniref:Negative regulator of sigma-X activity n=1 Tax=Cytobacillus dafuensis TaxID=1742359 RepID=A0A5B8Z5U8_CYTDA|nr:GerMN domain-containing protein [Cytobacillus dafuensis]QED48472.1 hypothetical protein FSZ17_15155 [Cytobacillus dafuensis]
MRKSEWSDEQIEELLGQLPKIIDERDPQEIYQNISIKLSRRKHKVWIMPTAATAAALLLLFILVPSLFNFQNTEEKSMESADKSSSGAEIAMEKKNITQDKEQNSTNDESAVPFAAKESNDMNENIGLRSIEAEDQSTAVYEEDIAGREVLTYAIPDDNVEFIVPVSIIVSNEENKTKFKLFEDNMKRLTENDWGLYDYYPLMAELKYEEDKKILNFDVPANQSYSFSGSTENILSQVLTSTMKSLNIKETNFSTDGNPGIDFGYNGTIEKFVPGDDQFGNHAYYFYYPSKAESKPFIVPNSEEVSTIEDAFSSMRKGTGNEKLIPSIPEDIQFETVKGPAENKLTIRFKKGSTINDDAKTLHTIEAILLTAKEFNYDAVKLENAQIDKIGKFNLDHEIKVPVAANKRTITH